MSKSDDDQVPMNKPEARKQQSIINNPSSLDDDDAPNTTLAQDPQTTMNANVPSSSVSAAIVVGNSNRNANGSNTNINTTGNTKPQEIEVDSNMNSSNNLMNANMDSKDDLRLDPNTPGQQSDYNLISPTGTLQAMTSFQMAVQSQDLNDQQLLARFAITLTYLLFSFFLTNQKKQKHQ